MRSQATAAESADPAWRGLYRLGAAAVLVAAIVFRRNLAAEFSLLRGLGVFRFGPAALPGGVSDCFAVLQEYPLLGLTLLGLFDIVNYALVGLIFLGLYAALRRLAKSAMTLATALGLAGVVLYLASNQAFAMLSLSKQYAAATTEAQRSMLLAAGQAVLAVHKSSADYGNGLYASFFLVSLAGLIMSTVMLRSRVFGRACAAAGIAANVLGLAYYVTLPFPPTWSAVSLSASALFLLVWYILIARGLLRLAHSARTDRKEDSDAQPWEDG